MKLVKMGGLDTRLTLGTDGDGGGQGPVVVLLHGFGAPGDDLVPLGRAFATTAPPGTRFLFPAAPLDLGRAFMGGRAWWWIDLQERMLRQARGEARDLNEVPEGLLEAGAQVTELLVEVERTLRPPPGKVVLGGFSQGAMLALDVALRSSAALAGVVLLSPTHLAASQWATRYEPRKGMPVFMSHGREDEILPFSVTEGLRGVLNDGGLPVQWVPFRGGHGIPPEVAAAASAFLGRVLG